MTPGPRAVEIIRDALRDSMWEGSEHPGEHFLSDGDVPGAADRIARWLADAGWSLLPPGGQTRELRARILDIADQITAHPDDHGWTWSSLAEDLREAATPTEEAPSE